MEIYSKSLICPKCCYGIFTDKWVPNPKDPKDGVIFRTCIGCGYRIMQLPLDYKETK